MGDKFKTILTGIKPTGEPHLGNYVGAIRPSLQEASKKNVKSYFFIADYHALTSAPDKETLKQHVYEVAACWLACGLNTKTSLFYLQSDLPELLELTWLLACMTPKGLMNRAHSYKAQVAKNQELGTRDPDAGINMGLYNYPILMAADILLFSPDQIPVGKDQVQHIEIARDIAKKFNTLYKKDVFKFPLPLITKEESLLGIDGQKMSKSYANHLPIFCNSKKLKKSIMKIKTDSTDANAPKDPSSCVIFNIYSHFASSQDILNLKERYAKGCSWGEAKETLFTCLESIFKDKREIYKDLLNQPHKLDKILQEGSEQARQIATSKMQEIHACLGLSKLGKRK